MSKEVKSLGNCPECGVNMDIAGKAHNCRPRDYKGRLIPDKILRELGVQPVPKSRPKPRGYGSMKGQLAVREDVDLTASIHARVEKAERDAQERAKDLEQESEADATDRRNAAKGLVVNGLRQRIALPPSHPDCRRCAEYKRRARETMRKRRAK